MKELIAITLFLGFWIYIFQTEKPHDGWRFYIWEEGRTVKKEWLYSGVFLKDQEELEMYYGLNYYYDIQVHNYNPKQFPTFWKTRGVDLDLVLKIEKIYKSDKK